MHEKLAPVARGAEQTICRNEHRFRGYTHHEWMDASLEPLTFRAMLARTTWSPLGVVKSTPANLLLLRDATHTPVCKREAARALRLHKRSLLLSPLE